MGDDDLLDDLAQNIDVLIRAELETQHRFGVHPTPLAECPVCQAHDFAGDRRFVDGPGQEPSLRARMTRVRGTNCDASRQVALP